MRTLEPLNLYSDNYLVYVFAESNNGKDDQSLPYPQLEIAFNILLTYHPDRPSPTTKTSVSDHNSVHRFLHPCRSQTSDDGSKSSPSWETLSAMISTINFPFQLQRLRWKKNRISEFSVPLESSDEMVSKILDSARAMVNSGSNGGRKKFCMNVMIRKQIILPRDEYLALIREREREEFLLRVQDTVYRMLRAAENLGGNFSRLDLEIVFKDVFRELGLENSGGSMVDSIVEWVSREMAELAAFRSAAPDAKPSVEALETVVYEVGGSENWCVVCLEEMSVGSRVTRMPCSHVFHGECIVRWLKRSHVCPVCRFNLPIQLMKF